MSPSEGYIREPSINGSKVAFVAEDDLWTVEVDSGIPRRWTSIGSVQRPLFSPAGDCIAFSVHADIWILSLDDGRYRRLTWFGDGFTWAVAWHEEGELLGATTALDPHDRTAIFSVPLQGGEPIVLHTGGYDAFLKVGSGICIGQHTCDPGCGVRWKGYRGGLYGQLWVDAAGEGQFQRLVLHDPEAKPHGMLNVGCPMFLEDRFWFVADPDGSANLWSCSMQGEDLKKHTDHDLFDARNAQGCGKTANIVYTWSGELWMYDPCEKARRLCLNFSYPVSNLRRFLDADAHCDGVTIHSEGRHVACLCRGQAFEMTLWEGPAVNLKTAGPTPKTGLDGTSRAVRCMALRYLWSGRLFIITDELAPLLSFTIHPLPQLPTELPTEKSKPMQAGHWIELLFADTGAPAQQAALDRDIGYITEVTPALTHDAVVLTTGRSELFLVEFTDGKERCCPENPYVKPNMPLQLNLERLDGSEFAEGISGACWSPDGDWIAYCRKDSQHGTSLLMLNLVSKDKITIADSAFENCEPCFDPEGRWLSFFSARTFAPVEDQITMDFSFASGAQLPYLILLREQYLNPFQRPPMSPSEKQDSEDAEGDDEDEDDESDESDEEDDDAPPEKIQVDVEGIQDRILPFPVCFGMYSGGKWTDNGKFQYVRCASRARKPSLSSDDDEEEDCGSLYVYDMKNMKEEKLMDNVYSFELDMLLKNMIVCSKGDEDEWEYRVVVAGQKPPGEGDEDGDDIDTESPGPESGILNINDRISLEVVPAEEWLHIFDNIHLHVKECLYDENCGGVDWDGCCQRYREVLPRLRCRSDLTDLCTELLAELGISHISLGDPEEDENGAGSVVGCQGRLGIQASWLDIADGGVYKVDSLVKGDVWDKHFSGPLARAGVGISEGSCIIAINRVKVRKEISLEQMLANWQNTEVFLTYVTEENLEDYTKLQELLAKNGGADGFRRLSVQQHRALQEKKVASGDKRNRRNKNKSKGKESPKNKDKGATKSSRSASKADEELEKKLAAMLRQIDVDVTCGPIWKTARVTTTSAMSQKNAALRDLVENRGHLVHEATTGRVGYFHVPNTTEFGFSEFYRYFTRECQRDALIVDLRCNGGGFASELFLKQLRNRFIGYEVPRRGRGKPKACPEFCPSGRTVLLVDENTSSDGEIWAETFQRFGLGKVVGRRTWGGVIAIGSADITLLDGSELTIPGDHFFMPGVGFALENRGVEPDVVVECPPSVKSSSEDPQLQMAIQVAQEMLATALPKPEIPDLPATRLHQKKL